MTGLRKFCEEKLGFPVIDTDLSSISLRGLYYPMFHKIELNELMEDTAKLSTLLHEMGHAMFHKGENGKGKSAYRKEFEADAVSVMISSHFEEDITDGRKVHLSENYKMLKLKESDTDISQCISDIFGIYKENIEEMERYVQREIERTPQIQAETAMDQCMKEYLAEKPVSKGIERDHGR